MTAATVHTITTPARTANRTVSLPGQRTAPPRLRLVPEPIPAVTASTATTVRAPGRRAPARPTSGEELQLTGRGRLVVGLALVALCAVLAFVVSGLVGGGAASPAPVRQQTRTVVVQPGQTLWSIARDIAPSADRRDTIARIVQLNALPSTDVVAGTHLAVPGR